LISAPLLLLLLLLLLLVPSTSGTACATDTPWAATSGLLRCLSAIFINNTVNFTLRVHPGS
jgi:hypothetical protein